MDVIKDHRNFRAFISVDSNGTVYRKFLQTSARMWTDAGRWRGGVRKREEGGWGRRGTKGVERIGTQKTGSHVRSALSMLSRWCPSYLKKRRKHQ